MTFVDKILPRRTFPLPYFEPVPLEFETQRCAKARPQVPTAGELSKSIEVHLRRGKAGNTRRDAATELRDALAELRRSLA
jgi:hypothetical protein